MLLVPTTVQVVLAVHPVDMRNSIDGLVAVVLNNWKQDVYAGTLFVFVSRRRDRVKILSWDNGGFVVFYKRLEAGRFLVPNFDADAVTAQLDGTQLAMLLDGIDVSRVRRPMKWHPPGDRQSTRNLISPDRWAPPKTSISASGATSTANSRASTKRLRPTSQR